MNSHLTLGVIGHVDHGKTSLVKAMTGIETDRLKEEKERGLSIVLGFSYLLFDEGCVDLIDTPGHEDFVRTMISGTTGVDGILLVIAADEGVKTQTVEHFNIARMLGIKQGIIAITKSDAVPENQRPALIDSLHPLVRASRLENAPLIFTSSVTGDGIESLVLQIRELLVASRPRRDEGFFYLPVDRVFSIAGFGTVTTGTLRHGRLRTGEIVELVPKGHRTRVRQLQIHGRTVKVASPGQRVAVNLRKVKVDDLNRGDVLCTPDLIDATHQFDAQLTLLPGHSRGIENGCRLRILFDTTEVLARARLLDRDLLVPGDTAFAQFRCERVVAGFRGEPFILRSYSPIRTIGSGRLINTSPRRHRRYSDKTLRELKLVSEGDLGAFLIQQISSAEASGTQIASLRKGLGLQDHQMCQLLDDLPVVIVENRLAIARSVFEATCSSVEAALDHFHCKHPLATGIPIRSLQATLSPQPSDLVFQHIVKTLIERGQIETERGYVRRSNFCAMANIGGVDQQAARAIEVRFKEGGTKPPSIASVIGDCQVSRHLFNALVESQVLVPVGDGPFNKMVVFHYETLEDVRHKLTTAYPPPTDFTVSDARILLNSTRKFVVPLLEFFDAKRITMRRGNLRRLTM